MSHTRTPTDREVRAATDELVEAWRTITASASRFPAMAESRFGISANRLHALLAIEEGAVRVQGVADMTWTSVSATSRTIDSLVREGLVDRASDPHDRRATLLSLTAQGRALMDEVSEWRLGFMRRATRDLGPQRVRDAARALLDVNEGMLRALDASEE